MRTQRLWWGGFSCGSEWTRSSSRIGRSRRRLLSAAVKRSLIRVADRCDTANCSAGTIKIFSVCWLLQLFSSRSKRQLEEDWWSARSIERHAHEPAWKNRQRRERREEADGHRDRFESPSTAKELLKKKFATLELIEIHHTSTSVSSNDCFVIVVILIYGFNLVYLYAHIFHDINIFFKSFLSKIGQ